MTDTVRSSGSAPISPDALEDLMTLLARLASGDLGARGLLTGNDALDAVTVGVNMLAEELQANRDELESRVTERTAQLLETSQLLALESAERLRVDEELKESNGRRIDELERMNGDIMQLTELGNLLQACNDPGEAFAVVGQVAGVLFAGLSGVVYLMKSSRDFLEAKARWGEAVSSDVILPDECWALRRGRAHVVESTSSQLACKHVTSPLVSSICVPMAAHGDTIGMLFVSGRRPDESVAGRVLTDVDRRLCQVVAEQVALSVANLSLREILRTQALRDPMTRLFNRRFAEEWMEQEADRADRSGAPLGMLMADIDEFKSFNDRFGHGAGDRVLVAVAEAMRRISRTGDVVCRYGGEEFLVLMPGVDRSAIEGRADELRAAANQVSVDYEEEALPAVTLSVGAAVYPEDGTATMEVVRAADAALYRAKQTGRNRVELSLPPTEPT